MNETSGARESFLEAKGLRKIYRMKAGLLEVLRGVSFSVARGETVAITGPSGAGKSTLLHALGGLDQPTGGTVRLLGRELYSLPPKERAAIRARLVGFVFQSYHLLPELDVLENVMLPAMAADWRGRTQAACRRRAEELLAAVGLAGRLRHTPVELSGGEQQRVALARALINEPELLLADEPTGNLDSKTGEQVLGCLFDLSRTCGRTLLLVTHNEEVARRCGRICRLRDGQIESDAQVN